MAPLTRSFTGRMTERYIPAGQSVAALGGSLSKRTGGSACLFQWYCHTFVRISSRAALWDHVTQRERGSSPGGTTHTHSVEEDRFLFTAIIVIVRVTGHITRHTQQSSRSVTCSPSSRQQRSPSPPHLQQNPLAPERQRYSGGLLHRDGAEDGEGG